MLPVAVRVPVAGSYSSADARTVSSRLSATPPATRTVPSGRRGAECSARAVIMLPAVLHGASSGAGEGGPGGAVRVVQESRAPVRHEHPAVLQQRERVRFVTGKYVTNGYVRQPQARIRRIGRSAGGGPGPADRVV